MICQHIKNGVVIINTYFTDNCDFSQQIGWGELWKTILQEEENDITRKLSIKMKRYKIVPVTYICSNMCKLMQYGQYI